jgi:hypothetical protein
MLILKVASLVLSNQCPILPVLQINHHFCIWFSPCKLRVRLWGGLLHQEFFLLMAALSIFWWLSSISQFQSCNWLSLLYIVVDLSMFVHSFPSSQTSSFLLCPHHLWHFCRMGAFVVFVRDAFHLHLARMKCNLVWFDVHLFAGWLSLVPLQRWYAFVCEDSWWYPL